jgi:hypothetical protein
VLASLVPPGSGWKCVYEHCNRQCVYPTTPRPPPGVAPSHPPCNDAKTAFCVGNEASAPNPPYALCFKTRADCEKSRANHGDFAVTACEED